MALGGGGGIRQPISLEGDTAVRRAFEQLGQTGAKAFNDIANASKNASRGINDFARSSTQGGGISGLIRQFTGLTSSVEGLSTVVRSVTVGLGALGVMQVGKLIASSVSEASAEFLKLNRLAKATNFDPNTVKAFQDALEDTGAEADAANRFFINLSQELAKSREAARATGAGFQQNVRVLRGMGDAAQAAAGNVTVLHGAEGKLLSTVETVRGSLREGKKDFGDVFKAAGLDASKYATTVAGTEQAAFDLLKRIVDLKQQGKVDQANIISFQLFGKSIKEVGQVIEDIVRAGSFEKLRQQLTAKDLNLTAERQALADALRRSEKEAQDSKERLRNALFDTFAQMQIGANEFEKNFITGLTNAFVEAAKAPALLRQQSEEQFGSMTAAFLAGASQLGNAFGEQGMLGTMLRDVQTIVPQIEAAFTSMWAALQATGQSVFESLSQSAASTASTIRGLLSGLGSIGSEVVPGIGAPQFAAGGMVHGPGSGTSDSILARLSAGEFVVNAAATARALPLLRAINDGLTAPLVPKRRFATGGLVTTGGSSGTPVHLHIGTNSFPLSGASGVVDALVVEAKRQHIRSAGVKPSWYGGRA